MHTNCTIMIQNVSTQKNETKEKHGEFVFFFCCLLQTMKTDGMTENFVFWEFPLVHKKKITILRIF